MSLANADNQRGLKDFLTLYNTITEFCFNKCVSNFNDRGTIPNENSCINTCTDNYVQYNQRFMFNFVDHQERRKRETEIAATELAAKNAAAAEAEALQANSESLNNPAVPNDTPSPIETSPSSDSEIPQLTTDEQVK